VVELCSVDLEGAGRVDLPAERRAVNDFDVAGGVIAATVTDAATPGEVVVAADGAERVLTDVNPWLRERFVAAHERHEFTARDGLKIEGWLLKPPGFDPSRKHPLVMEIHGGPHGQYGWAFFHEFQVLAGMGFLVFAVNPRGSDGYGEEFKRAVVGDWGGRDYEDLMTSLDQLIERTGFVDEARMGVGGGSYGGFMTNWIVGHTDRFAAAIAMRSISNLVSEYAQHDIVLWGQLEMGPQPWPDPDELWRRSPIRYVNEMRTPLLLLHGEMDLRCAISQAEELFGALRLLGREVELVRFPGESHDLSRNGRPDRRVERLRRIAGWFGDRLLARAPAAHEDVVQAAP
jgi:acylaminoacyl-peptidase